MKMKHSIPYCDRLVPMVVMIVFLAGSSFAQDKPDGRKMSDRERWSQLSPEDQKRLREALRTVWSDPKVLSARENVNRSVREYQEAIRETIANQDPETAKLLEKLNRGKGGLLPGGSGMEGAKRHYSMISNGRGLDQMLLPPSMIEKMDPEQKKRFMEVSKQARAETEVIAALRAVEGLHKEDEALRRKRFEALRKFRRSYFEAVARIDPELKKFIPPPRSKPPGPFGEKGRGGKKRPGMKGPPPGEAAPSGVAPKEGAESPPVQPGDGEVKEN